MESSSPSKCEPKLGGGLSGVINRDSDHGWVYMTIACTNGGWHLGFLNWTSMSFFDPQCHETEQEAADNGPRLGNHHVLRLAGIRGVN